jgi:hypothetical protein
VSRDLLLALIGAGGALLGGVVGGWSVVWTTAAGTRQARDERRRQAYAAFIVAMNQLHRLWAAPAAMSAAQAVKLLGPPTAQADEAIQQAYVTVLLAGPEGARVAADTARKAARDIYECLYPQPGKGLGSAPSEEQIKNFTDARHEFVKLAPRDVD